MRLANIDCRLFAVLALGLLSGGGCAGPRLPAIDPSGQRIFLPSPAYTTLDLPNSGRCRLPGLPEPAFRSPPHPPPCGAKLGVPVPVAPPATPAVAAPPAAPLRLILAPTRVIAPVGSEVVLLGGLCGADGNFITRQPLEWILSQDSVGHLVGVGGASHHWLPHWHTRPQKLASNFAITRTSHRRELLTRGTVSPNDDISVQKGQAWISVTSSSPGTSYLTAWAPQAPQWDQRRQSATIHWIDAQWSMPSPAIVRPGQTHTLTTSVQRISDGTPLAGWPVRYQVTGGPAVSLGADGAQSIEVTTDATGRARVPVAAQTTVPGTTQIKVEIIRPASVPGDLAPTVVGTGWTSVTWSAPGLAIQVVGPSTVGVNATATYRVQVSNPGDLPVRDVVVRDLMPPGMSFLNSTPPPQVYGNRLWNLGTLGPGDGREITINCRAEQNGDVRFCVEAESAGGLSARGCARTRIFTSSLAVQIEGPQRAKVGETIQYRIRVTNRGQQPLSNVVVTDTYDDGLQHAQGEASPIQKSLDTLEPGQTKEFAVTFVAKTAGRQCHRLDVAADGGHTALAQGCVQVEAAPAAAPARLQVRKTGPRQRRVGEAALYDIEVVNLGQLPARQLRIADSYAPSLEPFEATDRWQAVDGQLFWVVDQLEPGGRLIFQVHCRCIQADPEARNRVTVTAAGDLSVSDEAVTQILAADTPAPTEVTPPPERPTPRPQANGRLEVSIAETSDPVRVGDRTSYVIIIKNDRNVSDRDVSLTVFIPDGMRLENISGPTAAQNPVGNTIVLTPVAEVRRGETLDAYRVEVSALRAGRLAFRIKVTSLRSAEAIEKEEQTTVFSP